MCTPTHVFRSLLQKKHPQNVRVLVRSPVVFLRAKPFNILPQKPRTPLFDVNPETGFSRDLRPSDARYDARRSSVATTTNTAHRASYTNEERGSQSFAYSLGRWRRVAALCKDREFWSRPYSFHQIVRSFGQRAPSMLRCLAPRTRRRLNSCIMRVSRARSRHVYFIACVPTAVRRVRRRAD